MNGRERASLDRYITGDYGERQFDHEFTGDGKLSPSPAAMAFATRVTEEQFQDVTLFASMIDVVAEEARRNERARIFSMSLLDLLREFRLGKRLKRASSNL